MTHYRILQDGAWLDVEAIGEAPEPGSPDDPVIMLEARFTFDGRAEYQEFRVDGELTDVRILDAED